MEVWKSVKDYEDTHLISNCGRLVRIIKGSPMDGGEGYLISTLSDNKRRRTALIHILVCQAFYGERPKGYVVNHKDGNKGNNRSDNLEWVTHSQNHLHAFANHLRISQKGSQTHRAKLTEHQIVEICESNDQAIILSRRYGVSTSTISAIQTGKIWKHVDCLRRRIKRKLTSEDVNQIRDSRNKVSQRQLARIFNVSQHLIKEVQLDKIYKNIGA